MIRNLSMVKSVVTVFDQSEIGRIGFDYRLNPEKLKVNTKLMIG